MGKVYISQDVGKINFLPAEEFGELVPVINGYVNHTQLKRAMARMQDVMRDITVEDWLVPAGHPALIALAGYCMAERTGYIRILSWDNLINKYVPSEIRVR